MTRLLVTSDLHLGHKNICKYREQFNSSEEHDEVLWDNLASSVNKHDTVFFLGDIAFTPYWLDKIKHLKVAHKRLIVGNHDTERGITMRHLCDSYDSVVSFMTHKNYWLSHCPIHPQEMRGRNGNIHGHLHGKVVDDPLYFNACVEHTEYKPILWGDLTGRSC